MITAMVAQRRGKLHVSVIVCTYNEPQRLDLVFCGLARQSRMPEEIIIADDGSGPETAAVVEYWNARLDTHVEHVWHVDSGFRKSRISNHAARQSTGDLLIFLDGDSIPHHRWVEDHVVAMRPNRISCGRRVKLSESLSGRVDRTWVEKGRLAPLSGPVLWSAIKSETTRYAHTIRLPAWAARIVRPRARRLMGVNFSLPREAFERVNGYDQEPGVRARIDRELALRLRRCGYRFYPLLQRAIVYHLYHPERRSIRDPTTLEWLAKQQASDRTRCELGYDTPFDAQT